MVYNRKAIAPWSTEREQGIESATVDSNIETPQYLQPVVNTGTIDLNGNWIGNVTSDKTFTIDTEHLAIPNGGTVLVPQKADHEYIDMTGYRDLQIAIKPSNAGAVAMYGVMAPAQYPYANLTPVDAAGQLKGAYLDVEPSDIDTLFQDTSTALTANVWNIFMLKEMLSNQKLLQFSIINNSGGNSDITFAYLRIV